MAAKGKLLYQIYRALTYGLSPLLYLHVHWRRIRGLEHSFRWPERLGRPSLPRPPGPLLWFHAVSLGEGMATISVVKQCIQQRPDLNILMTTTTTSAFEVIRDLLPPGVIYQFAPIDTPTAVDTFISHWRPNAIVIMESELWPNLLLSASKCKINLALLNARVSARSFKLWSGVMLLPLISLMLSKFSLIVPMSNLQAVQFQLLQAPPHIINFSGDLKFVETSGISEKQGEIVEDLRLQLTQRQVWMASSIHRGEEKVMLGVHNMLLKVHPNLLTIIVPRHPQHGKEIAQKLENDGQHVALRSQNKKLGPGNNIYVVDTLGELRYLYMLTPVAVVGGSFLPGLAGHNVSEAAAAGCAVLTGPHLGHFSHMVHEMLRVNHLSVLQVHGEPDLGYCLNELLDDAKVLEAHRRAAKQAHQSLARGIIARVLNLLNSHVLGRIMTEKPNYPTMPVYFFHCGVGWLCSRSTKT